MCLLVSTTLVFYFFLQKFLSTEGAERSLIVPRDLIPEGSPTQILFGQAWFSV